MLHSCTCCILLGRKIQTTNEQIPYRRCSINLDNHQGPSCLYPVNAVFLMKVCAEITVKY